MSAITPIHSLHQPSHMIKLPKKQNKRKKIKLDRELGNLERLDLLQKELRLLNNLPQKKMFRCKSEQS